MIEAIPLKVKPYAQHIFEKFEQEQLISARIKENPTVLYSSFCIEKVDPADAEQYIKQIYSEKLNQQKHTLAELMSEIKECINQVDLNIKNSNAVSEESKDSIELGGEKKKGFSIFNKRRP